MERKRRIEISALNVLFCLIVIFIHVVSYPVSKLPANTLKYNMVMVPWRLSSFVVQGFILLSGVKLFLTKKDTMPFSKYIKARFFAIIVPYIICFLIYYVCFIVIFDYPLNFGFIIKHFLLGSLACHLYFIPILFQFDILFPVWKRLVNKYSEIFIIPFALLISQLFENALPQVINTFFPDVSFIYNDRIFTTYLSYWLIGCYIGKRYDGFCELLKKNFKAVCVLFGFSLVLMIFFSYLAYNNIAQVPFMHQIHSLYVICVCIFLYALVVKIPADVLEKIPLISKLDSISFLVYLYHMLVIFAIDALLKKFGIYAEGISFVIRATTVYLLTPSLCLLYRFIIKNRSLPRQKGAVSLNK